MLRKLFTRTHTEIHPENFYELQYWARKLRVSVRDLNEAIIDTGSVDIDVLRRQLDSRRRFNPFSFFLKRTA